VERRDAKKHCRLILIGLYSYSKQISENQKLLLQGMH
jgi:hypothetical protein